jgi:hypothetical protein
MIRPGLAVLFALVCASAGSAALEPPGPTWGGWKGLVGNWVAEEGPAAGSFSFAFDLDGRILVRHNHAEGRAAGGRAASSHRDLLVLYPEAAVIRGDYWDKEGHAIHYRGSDAAENGTLTLTSDLVAGAPRYRLSYTTGGARAG